MLKNIITFAYISFSVAFGALIIIPDDYTTIQAGINASTSGDTVLVSNGDYYENIIIDKSIVLASYAIYDDLSNWVTEESGVWVVSR